MKFSSFQLVTRILSSLPSIPRMVIVGSRPRSNWGRGTERERKEEKRRGADEMKKMMNRRDESNRQRRDGRGRRRDKSVWCTAHFTHPYFCTLVLLVFSLPPPLIWGICLHDSRWMTWHRGIDHIFIDILSINQTHIESEKRERAKGRGGKRIIISITYSYSSCDFLCFSWFLCFLTDDSLAATSAVQQLLHSPINSKHWKGDTNK